MSRLSFCAIVLAACTTSGPVKDDGVNTEPATPVQLDPTGSTGATGLVAFFPSLATGELSVKKTTAAIEEILIRRALQKTRGNRTRAAELLEISHRALLYKIQQYQLHDTITHFPARDQRRRPALQPLQ